MYRPNSASSEAQRARILGGSSAILAFLRGQFPKSRVQVFPGHTNEAALGARTFEIRSAGHRSLVKVAEDVLDLGAEGAMRVVRQLPVARTVRNTLEGEVVVIKAHEVTVEPPLTGTPDSSPAAPESVPAVLRAASS